MSAYTNDFKNDPTLDEEMSVKAQRTLLEHAIQRQIFCPVTGVLLDIARAVLVMPSQGRMQVMDASVWDDRHEIVAQAAAGAGVTLEVYDGREL